MRLVESPEYVDSRGVGINCRVVFLSTLYLLLFTYLKLPGGVIGNTREFGSRFPGSSPGWAAQNQNEVRFWASPESSERERALVHGQLNFFYFKNKGKKFIPKRALPASQQAGK